jgi:hypothetical protein
MNAYLGLMLCILRNISVKGPLQYSSIRLMSAKKEQEAAPVPERRFPLALPAASDVAESVPTTEVNSAFKLHDLGPVGRYQWVSCSVL